MSATTRGYSRLRLMIVLAVIGGAIVADHVGSPTFRMNMGEGGFETTLTQRQAQAGACAPCGAPCRDAGEDSAAQ